MQLVRLGGHASVIRVGIFSDKVVMGGSGKDPVDPSLLVLVAWSSKGRAGQLLGIEAIGSLLRRVLTDGECAFDGFGPIPQSGIVTNYDIHQGHVLVVGVEASLVLVGIRVGELSRGHDGGWFERKENRAKRRGMHDRPLFVFYAEENQFGIRASPKV